jgi:hypothetical protein
MREPYQIPGAEPPWDALRPQISDPGDAFKPKPAWPANTQFENNTKDITRGPTGGPRTYKNLYATTPLQDQFKLAAAAEAATKLPWGGAREIWPRNQANMPLPQTGPQPNPITGGPMAPPQPVPLPPPRPRTLGMGQLMPMLPPRHNGGM